MKIEVSNGEIVDKLTIIEIKLLRIKDKTKQLNLKKEYEILDAAVMDIIGKDHPLYRELFNVNLKLWDIEDRIREMEKTKNFGNDFIETARSVYFTNDRRSEIKRKINRQTGSDLIEEKSYEDYEG